MLVLLLSQCANNSGGDGGRTLRHVELGCACDLFPFAVSASG